MVCLHKVTLEKGNPPNMALCLLASRSQHCGALCLHFQHPLLGLPLSQGAPIFDVPGKSCGALPCRSGFLSRSLYRKLHCDASGFHSSGNLPSLGHL
jgi:hypothetical protein